MTPEAYCTSQVNRSRSSFRLGFLLLNSERRQAIHALYAFCREVDDIVDDATDSGSASEQLNRWRDEIRALYKGQPSHPVTVALLPAIRGYQLSQNHFLAIIEGMEMDLQKSRYANFDELYSYCYRAAGAVGLLAAAIFGFKDPHTEEYAEAMGIALQLTNILRDVGEDLARGRIYIPQDELSRFGLNDNTLSDPNYHAELTALLQFQQQRAREYYHKALTLLPAVDRKAQLSGLAMGAIYHALLNEIVHQNYPVLNRKVRITTFQKLLAITQYMLRRRYD
jgi:phytoene synthase